MHRAPNDASRRYESRRRFAPSITPSFRMTDVKGRPFNILALASLSLSIMLGLLWTVSYWRSISLVHLTLSRTNHLVLFAGSLTWTIQDGPGLPAFLTREGPLNSHWIFETWRVHLDPMHWRERLKPLTRADTLGAGNQ